MKTFPLAVASGVFGVAFFAVFLFVPAGTVAYWQAWVFIAVFTIATLAPSAYLAMTNPAVLRRRLRAGPTADTRGVQKIAVTGIVVMVVVVLVVSALDHRFGWSHVPTPAVIAGAVLVAIGLGIAQLVVVQNSYAAATITVESEQTLVSTGLYSVVRHPMYLGALIMLIGTPPALDSYWALIAVLLILPLLGLRIADEERMLVQDLDGYREYMIRVPYRLVPHVW